MTDFPRIPCLACDKCFGTGDAPHESWSPAQREWYEKWCKIGWNRRLLSEYAPDEGGAIPKCNGTGKLSVSARKWPR